MRIVMLGLCALCLVGCGSSGISPAALAADMRLSVRRNDHGSRFEHVHCAHQQGSRWECDGDYTATRADVKQQMASVDTSTYSAADWRALGVGVTRSVVFEVIVNDDGSFVYRSS